MSAEKSFDRQLAEFVERGAGIAIRGAEYRFAG